MFRFLKFINMDKNHPEIHICPCCGKAFFEEEGLEFEIYCIDCRDPWWRKED